MKTPVCGACGDTGARMNFDGSTDGTPCTVCTVETPVCWACMDEGERARSVQAFEADGCIRCHEQQTGWRLVDHAGDAS